MGKHELLDCHVNSDFATEGLILDRCCTRGEKERMECFHSLETSIYLDFVIPSILQRLYLKAAFVPFIPWSELPALSNSYSSLPVRLLFSFLCRPSRLHPFEDPAMVTPRRFARTFSVPALTLTFLSSIFSAEAWGTDGHQVICNIAETLLTEIARESIEELLPDNADGNLSGVCNWADGIKRRKGYEWSAPLHFIETPNNECNYKYIRDCRDDVVKPGFCTSGAINNYTSQMDTDSDEHNLTEALMFLAHFVADIHQPLHVGFEGDHGGSSISLYWYNVKSNLHNVWDTDMIMKANNVFFGGDISRLTTALLKNIKTIWKAEAKIWTTCGGGEIACPDEYARESIELACEWAYPHAEEGGSLSDTYFRSRIPVLQKRLAQAAVRLAAILNALYTGT